MKHIFPLLSLFLCISIIHAQDTRIISSDVQKGWKTFTDTNYTIQYPPEWELNQSGLMGSSFILFQPLESSDDLFRENVNLLIQDVSGYHLDLDQYAEISENQVTTMITNSTLIESKRIKTGPEEYHRMIYTGDQGTYHLKFVQYYWIKEEKAIVLTFTCEQDKYEVNKEIGNTIMNSFAFKGRL